jgi:hypothetical protein
VLQMHRISLGIARFKGEAEKRSNSEIGSNIMHE